MAERTEVKSVALALFLIPILMLPLTWAASAAAPPVPRNHGRCPFGSLPLRGF
jgi:hypothetical protein